MGKMNREMQEETAELPNQESTDIALDRSSTMMRCRLELMSLKTSLINPN